MSKRKTTHDAARETRSAPAASEHEGSADRVHAPINAAEAAHRAARADGRELDRLRHDAAGQAVQTAPQMRSRTNRLVVMVPALIGILCAALLICVVGSAVAGALLADDTEAIAAADEADSGGQSGSVVRVADGETIEANGYTYSIIQQDDGYAFGYQYADSDAESLALFEITGDPVGFALYQGVFYLLSNADGVFYVQSYVHSDGSAAVDYYHAEGTMTDLALDEDQLVLTDTEGRTYTLALAS